MAKSYSEVAIVPVEGTARARLVSIFQDEVALAQEKLKKFSEGVLTDAYHTMQWADNTFMYVARRAVAQRQLACLAHYWDIEEILEINRDRVMNGAKHVYNKSTSVSGNYITECTISAEAEALDKFRYIKDLDKVSQE